GGKARARGRGGWKSAGGAARGEHRKRAAEERRRTGRRQRVGQVRPSAGRAEAPRPHGHPAGRGRAPLVRRAARAPRRHRAARAVDGDDRRLRDRHRGRGDHHPCRPRHFRGARLMRWVAPLVEVLNIILSVILWIVFGWVILSWIVFFASQTSFRWRNRTAYNILMQLNEIFTRMAYPFVLPFRRILPPH